MIVFLVINIIVISVFVPLITHWKRDSLKSFVRGQMAETWSFFASFAAAISGYKVETLHPHRHSTVRVSISKGDPQPVMFVPRINDQDSQLLLVRPTTRTLRSTEQGSSERSQRLWLMGIKHLNSNT